MSSARRAHKLSSGMVVSGLPPPTTPKARTTSLSSAAPPFTGAPPSASSRPLPLPIPRTSSGPLLPPTGLITSAPIFADKKPAPAPDREIRFWFWLPKPWLAASVAAFAVAIGVGVFLWVGAGRPQVLGAVAGVGVVVAALGLWNWGRGRRELERCFRAWPDTSVSPRTLPVGKLVKLTGLVTCGNTPLDSSYQNVPRCAYTSIELHERKARNLSIASYTAPSWTLRYFERHVTDFYLSDLNSGTRILVRAGNGAKVVSFIKPATTLHVSMKNKEQFPSFLRWLQNNNIPTDGFEMRFEEGYVREGSTVSVLGTLKTHENLIMIDPPDEASSTGWQWMRCILPMHVVGLILIGDETPLEELCHV